MHIYNPIMYVWRFSEPRYHMKKLPWFWNKQQLLQINQIYNQQTAIHMTYVSFQNKWLQSNIIMKLCFINKYHVYFIYFFWLVFLLKIGLITQNCTIETITKQYIYGYMKTAFRILKKITVLSQFNKFKCWYVCAV